MEGVKEEGVGAVMWVGGAVCQALEAEVDGWG